MNDRIRDADRHHLRVRRAAQEVVEPARHQRRPHPVAGQKGQRGRAVPRVGPREVDRRVGRVRPVPVYEVARQVLPQVQGFGRVARVVARVQDADADSRSAWIADTIPCGL